MAGVLVDTGPLVALFNARDAHHEWALSALNGIQDPLHTSDAVLTEVLFLLFPLAKSRKAFGEFWLSGSLVSCFDAEAQKASILRLMKKYEDLPMSFADATLVRMSEIDNESKIWTIDRHFKIYRRNGRQVIRTLSFPEPG